MKTKLLITFLIISTTVNAQGVWTQRANHSAVNRYRAAAFTIGTKAYAGTGWDISNNYLDDFWMWNQATNTWTQKANFGGGVRRDCFAFSIGGKGYFGAGHNGGGEQKDLWEYDTLTNAWSQKTQLPSAVRQQAIGFSIGTKGYVGTGWNGTYLQDFWEWDQTGNSWTQKATFQGTGRYGSIGFSMGTKGYVGLGYDGVNKKDFWEWDQGTNVWTQKANFVDGARNSCVSFVIGNYAYVGTGSDSTGKQKTFYKWSSINNTWSQVATLTGNQRTEAYGFSIAGLGYVGTGNDGSGPTNDFWEFNPCDNLSTTLTAGGATSFCNGNATTLNVSGGNNYSWNTGQTTSSVVITPTTTTTYSVTISDLNGCAKTDSIKITVYPLPATPTISVNGVVLMSSSSTNNQWYLNGNLISSATSQFYTVTQNGFYSVCVTDANNCSSCSTPYNFTTVGLETADFENNIFNIYPNPFSSSTTLQTDAPLKNATLTVVNCFGQTVAQIKNINGQSITFNRGNLPCGLYFIRLTTPSPKGEGWGEVISTGKLVITD